VWRASTTEGGTGGLWGAVKTTKKEGGVVEKWGIGQGHMIRSRRQGPFEWRGGKEGRPLGGVRKKAIRKSARRGGGETEGSAGMKSQGLERKEAIPPNVAKPGVEHQLKKKIT